MWTSKNRARYDRSKLRYPSDLTDDEWGLARTADPAWQDWRWQAHGDQREVVNGLMYILSTGCPPAGTALPRELKTNPEAKDGIERLTAMLAEGTDQIRGHRTIANARRTPFRPAPNPSEPFRRFLDNQRFGER